MLKMIRGRELLGVLSKWAHSPLVLSQKRNSNIRCYEEWLVMTDVSTNSQWYLAAIGLSDRN